MLHYIMYFCTSISAQILTSISSRFSVDKDDMKSSKRHVTSLLSLIFFLKSLTQMVFKTSITRELTGLIVTSINITISAHGEKRKTLKSHHQFQNNWVFSHDVTKIQTRKFLFFLRFYFHDVYEQLKTSIHTNFHSEWVLDFVIDY